jgi:hypothetical protein
MSCAAPSLASAAGRADEPLDAGGVADLLALVTAEIVEDEDLALCQRQYQHLLDIEGEEFPLMKSSTFDGALFRS